MQVTDPAACLNSGGLKLSARLRGLSWFLELCRQRRAKCRTTLSSVRPYWAGQAGELDTPRRTWAHSSRSRTSADQHNELLTHTHFRTVAVSLGGGGLYSHLALLGSFLPAARRGGWARADPAGTGTPRHTGRTPPAAPGLKTNTPRVIKVQGSSGVK